MVLTTLLQFIIIIFIIPMTAKEELTASEPAWTTVEFKKISTLSREVDMPVKSESFKHEGTSWIIKMYIGGDSEEAKNYCSIFLMSLSVVKASYSIKLVNPEHEKRSKRLGPVITSFTADTGNGWTKFTTTKHLLDPIDGFLLNDTITVKVQIEISREIKVNGADYSMPNAMQTLLFDETTSDFTIVFK